MANKLDSFVRIETFVASCNHAKNPANQDYSTCNRKFNSLPALLDHLEDDHHIKIGAMDLANYCQRQFFIKGLGGEIKPDAEIKEDPVKGIEAIE